MGDLGTRGSYTGSVSPYCTFDLGGNVFEWNEAIIGGVDRGVRGGSFASSPSYLSAANRIDISPTFWSDDAGFRLSMIPESGTGVLAVAGLLASPAGAGHARSSRAGAFQ